MAGNGFLDVGFNLVTDASGFITGIEKAQNAQNDLAAETKQFETQSKNSFKNSASEVDKLTAEFEEGVKKTGQMINEVNKLGKTKSAVQALKAEIKFYTSEALKAGEGTKAFAENLEKAGKLKDELADLNAAVSSLNGNIGENFARAAGNSISLVAKGFEGLTAIQVLAGDENKEFEKTLLRLQSLNAVASLAQEFAGIKDKLTEIKLGFKPLTDLYVKGNDAIKTFFKSGATGAATMAAENKGLFSSISGGIKSVVSGGIQQFKALWATIAANPLGVFLVLIGTLVLLKDTLKPVGKLIDAIGESIKFLLSPFVKLAEAIGLIADQEEKSALKRIKNSEKNIKAAQEEYDYKIALAKLEGKSTSKLEADKLKNHRDGVNGRIADLELLRKKNRKLSEEQVEEYEKAQEEIVRLSREASLRIASENAKTYSTATEFDKIARNSRIQSIANDQVRETTLAKTGGEDRLKELRKQYKEVDTLNSEAGRAYYEAKIAIENETQKQLSDINEKYAKKAAEEAKKNNEKLLSLQKEFADLLAQIYDKANKARLAGLSGEERINEEERLAIAELAVLRKKLIEKGQAEENFDAEIHKRRASEFRLNLEQQEQFNIIERQIRKDASQARFDAALSERRKLVEAEVKTQNEIAKARTDSAKADLDNSETSESIEISIVKSLKKPKGTSEAEFEKQQQIAILEIQRKYANERLRLLKASLEAERNEKVKNLNGELELLGDGQDAETQRQRDAVLERLRILEKSYGLQIDLAEANFSENDALIEQELTKLKQKEPFSLAKLFGVTDSQFEIISNAVDDIISIYTAGLDAQINSIDAGIQESQKIIDARQKDIDDLKGKLDEEQQLKEQGKANNVARINEEIAAAEAAKAREEEGEKEALERKKEIQKQKLLIDSVAQAGNLITAASQIYASATLISGPAGVAIAGIAIAAMLGAFAAQKIATLKAINSGNENNFKDGVFNLKGPGTETSDSIQANLSKGETVFSAKDTRKYYDTFYAIHSGNQKLIDDALIDLVNGRGIALMPDINDSISKRKHIIKQYETKNYYYADNTGVESKLSSIESIQKDLLKEQRTKIYSDKSGNIIYKTGSHTRVVKPAKT